jgi:hypothetical protein
MRAPLAVTPEEKVLIESALKFANVKKIKSTHQVETIFQRNVPLVGPKFQVLRPQEHQQYGIDQRELQGWLQASTKATHARKQVAAELAKRLETVHMQATFHEGHLAVSFALRGVQACYSYAVALILDERRNLAGKLAQCGWSRCRRFRLDFSPKGRPRRFCNPKHKWRAEAEERRRLNG